MGAETDGVLYVRGWFGQCRTWHRKTSCVCLLDFQASDELTVLELCVQDASQVLHEGIRYTLSGADGDGRCHVRGHLHGEESKQQSDIPANLTLSRTPIKSMLF